MAASLALTSGLVRRSDFLAAFAVAAVPLTLAHRALVAAIMAARPAALNRLLCFLAGLAAARFHLAHRALAPAAILARAAADMRRRPALKGTGLSPLSPVMVSSLPCSFSILCLIAITRLS